jgi:hypothetical protein
MICFLQQAKALDLRRAAVPVEGIPSVSGRHAGKDL